MKRENIIRHGKTLPVELMKLRKINDPVLRVLS